MPGSPKEYTEWFDFKEHKKEYKEPITKERNRFLKINKEKHKVITEPIGFLVNGSQKGTSSTPGILFDFITLGELDYKKAKEDLKRAKSEKKPVKKRGKKDPNDKEAFVPASLKKMRDIPNK